MGKRPNRLRVFAAHQPSPNGGAAEPGSPLGLSRTEVAQSSQLLDGEEQIKINPNVTNKLK